MSSLTTENICAAFSYDAHSGALRWAIKTSQRVSLGDFAGTNVNGYLCVKLRGKRFLVHRIIWQITAGVEPVGQIDHIDGNKMNNRISNLRDVSASFNQQNRHYAQHNSVSGRIGVRKHRNKFQAQIKVNGRKLLIGSFNTLEEASAAYFEAKTLLHPGYVPRPME